MAKRTITVLTDDLDGTELVDGSGETITFAIDGTEYEIDLSQDNAAKLRDALAVYVAAGSRKSGTRSGRGRGRARTTQGDGPSPSDVRAWAQANNVAVNERGRIPADVYAKFSDAN